FPYTTLFRSTPALVQRLGRDEQASRSPSRERSAFTRATARTRRLRLGEFLEEEGLGRDHPAQLLQVHPLVGRVDGGVLVLRAEEQDLRRGELLEQRVDQRDRPAGAHVARRPAEGALQRAVEGGARRAAGVGLE